MFLGISIVAGQSLKHCIMLGAKGISAKIPSYAEKYGL